MRVLLVKLSSLGDVIHNLTVASDLARARPGIEIDWAVEAPYAEIVALHPSIKNVFPVPLRNLKKNWRSNDAWRNFLEARSRLSAQRYDTILDTQGLLKSAWIANWPQGPVSGFSRRAAREPFAAGFYDHRFDVPRAMHAVERNRQLAAHAFGYPLDTPARFGIAAPTGALAWLPRSSFVVFLHATSRANKMWPEPYWISLGQRLGARNINIVLPWGNPAECEMSVRIAAALPNSIIPPALSLSDAARLLSGATAVVGVDTGLAHLSVALGRPTIGIYVTTEPALTGLHGADNAINLGGGNESSPATPGVELVWQTLESRLGGAQR